jgi:Ca2+-binding EF-hand superfamily protein
LKNKLAQKTQGAQSEESVMKKSFKYFDLNDNGTVEPDEFAKAIEKIGIQIPTKKVSDHLRNLNLTSLRRAPRFVEFLTIGYLN